jgi:hypothetical protein
MTYVFTPESIKENERIRRWVSQCNVQLLVVK